MAQSEGKSFTLDLQERLWVKQSLSNQRKMIVRSNQKEVAGSGVYELRLKELAVLDTLLVKFG